MIFLTIIAIPFVIALFSYVISLLLGRENKITWKELLIQVAVVLVISGISAAIIGCPNLNYDETWNGHVVKKWHEKVHCRHSYQCNCVTICSGGKNPTCSTICQTCYEHSYDVDWNVKDNTGAVWSIDTQDRQGLMMPAFWKAVEMDDPTSHLHSYKNYIRAAPDSLFHKQGLVEKYKKSLPNYPQKIYNYYDMDRIVTVGIKINNQKAWNRELAYMNGQFGKGKQCNAILVLVRNKPRDYFQALQQHWAGGNKNDAILVISLDDSFNIQWADVMGFVKDSIFKVKLRDDIENLKVYNSQAVLQLFNDNIVENYKRAPFSKYAYLTDSFKPSMAQYVVTIIICSLVSIGLSVFFYKEDIEELFY